jgi:hypothetical protein
METCNSPLQGLVPMTPNVMHATVPRMSLYRLYSDLALETKLPIDTDDYLMEQAGSTRVLHGM